MGQEWQNQSHNLLYVNFGKGASSANLVTLDPWFRPWLLPPAVKKFSPDLAVYFPNASLNIYSALRSYALRALFPGVKLVLIALQPTTHLRSQIWAIRLFRGFDKLLVQSKRTAEDLKGIGRAICIIPSGVDRSRFHRVSPENKLELRKKHGIRSGLPLVLHVGHLRCSRNVEKLLPLQKDGIAQLILIGSTSTPQDESLKQQFREAGAVIIDYFLEQIEEWYQIADLYIFPVVLPTAALEFPLSILEALASGLPVVSTPFGGLPDFFSQKDGVVFVSEDELVAQASKVLQTEPIEVPELSGNFDWGNLSKRVLLDLGFSTPVS